MLRTNVTPLVRTLLSYLTSAEGAGTTVYPHRDRLLALSKESLPPSTANKTIEGAFQSLKSLNELATHLGYCMPEPCMENADLTAALIRYECEADNPPFVTYVSYSTGDAYYVWSSCRVLHSTVAELVDAHTSEVYELLSNPPVNNTGERNGILRYADKAFVDAYLLAQSENLQEYVRLNNLHHKMPPRDQPIKPREANAWYAYAEADAPVGAINFNGLFILAVTE